MKSLRSKKGFTLVEVLISTTVIVLVVFASTTLLVSVIRSNTENVNTLIAYGLAQEGLEGVRNIRDSNWLLGGTFSGKVGKIKSAPWGGVFPEPGDRDTSYFTIDLKEPDTFPSEGQILSGQLVNFAPWELTELDEEDDLSSSEKTLLYKQETDTTPQETHYTHDKTGSATMFHRYVMVTLVEDEKFRVASVVNWREFGRKKEVRLDTELTNWKAGPL